MKRFVLLFVVIALAIGGCHFPPDLVNVPRITFRNMYFTKVPAPEQDIPPSDALVLEFDFEDGDGDIGLDDSFNDFKFQRYHIVKDGTGQEVKYNKNNPDLPAFNARDYEVIYQLIEGKRVPKDTFLVVRNENHYNLFISLYTIKNGKATLFDPWERLQQTFNARIPVIRKDVKSTQGTIKYKWVSTSWPYLVPNDSVQIKFHIKDRELNQSNTIETPPFLIRVLMNQAQ